MSNPFKYTDRTYISILSSINDKPELADKPEWFKRLIAGLGDVFSVMIDAVSNDSVLETALTRESTQALLKLIDYEIGLRTTSIGNQVFNVKTETPNGTTFSNLDLIASTEGSLAASSKKYQSRSSSVYNLSISNFVRLDSTQFSTGFDYNCSGRKIRLITTGTLPTGLFTDTDYYIIYINSNIFSLALSIDNAFNNIPIETTDAGIGTHTAQMYSFKSLLYQQESKENINIGRSDGVTPFQEFILPDKNIITDDTFIVNIGGDIYSEIDSLANSNATDKVYKILNKSDGIIALLFGNNELGIIPPQVDIICNYNIGGGSLSNQSALNSITVYSGTNQYIETTTNGEQYTGGSDEESIEIAKIRGPILLKARNRFITKEDGEALILALGGLSYVNIIRNAFGVLTVQVVGVALGGGNPSSEKKLEIEQELISKSILESVAVTVSDSILISPAVTCDIKKINAFDFNDIETQTSLGLKLFFTETGREIKNKYIGSGISETVVLINSIFNTNFSSNDNIWIERLVENLEPVSFNAEINESSIIAYIKSNVSGIADITFTSPTFPLILGNIEVTTHTGISIIINEVI